jgi:hypothetical protein
MDRRLNEGHFANLLGDAKLLGDDANLFEMSGSGVSPCIMQITAHSCLSQSTCQIWRRRILALIGSLPELPGINGEMKVDRTE